MFAIALSLNPSARACAKASSRFGPIVDDDPTAAREWHPAHFSWNSFLPFCWSVLADTIPPVPQAASPAATAATASAATRSRTLRARRRLRRRFQDVRASLARPSEMTDRHAGTSRLRWRLFRRLELGDGLVAGGVDGEDAVEAGDLED